MKAGISFPRKSDLKITPSLYATEDVSSDEKLITMKLFSPYAPFTWYVCEIDPETNMAFGFVDGPHGEWGYIDLNELKSARVFGGRLPAVEQDVYFTPTKFGDLDRH